MYILTIIVDLKHISVCLEFLRFVDNHSFYTAIEAFSQKSNLCFNGEIGGNKPLGVTHGVIQIRSVRIVRSVNDYLKIVESSVCGCGI